TGSAYFTIFGSLLQDFPNQAGSLLSAAPASSPATRVNAGYIPVPKLDRLMELRDAVVALNGPLANDPGLRENVHNLLFNDEASERVLGKVSGPLTPFSAR
ncbi:type VI secretion system contractile sheath small subunit, partial [Pseudomonas sp. SDO528_S397]